MGGHPTARACFMFNENFILYLITKYFEIEVMDCSIVVKDVTIVNRTGNEPFKGKRPRHVLRKE
jgi:hypothetical protein